MKTDVDFAVIRHYWNHLSPMQKKLILLRAHFYLIKNLINAAIVFCFVVVSFSVTPMPIFRERRFAHWIVIHDRRRK